MTKEEIEKCKKALELINSIKDTSVIYVCSTLEHTIQYAEYDNMIKEMAEQAKQDEVLKDYYYFVGGKR